MGRRLLLPVAGFLAAWSLSILAQQTQFPVPGTVTLPTSSGAGGAGTGTVTSVDMSVPSVLAISGNPITTSGTLALTYSGTALPFANGGTGLTAAADDTVMVSSGSAWVAKAMPNCTDTGGNHINYATATNTFSCGTSGGASGANTALGNLASVAINASLLPGVDDSIDLGSASFRWRDVITSRDVDVGRYLYIGGAVGNTTPLIQQFSSGVLVYPVGVTDGYKWYFTSTKYQTTSANLFGWTANLSTDAMDTGFARNAAGIVEVNNGTAGTLRDMTVRHYLSGGSAPTVSSCGTGTVTTGSSDQWGEVTATGATACTVNFNAAWSTVAFCVIEDESTLSTTRISSISTSAFTVTGLTSGDKFMYHCGGK